LLLVVSSRCESFDKLRINPYTIETKQFLAACQVVWDCHVVLLRKDFLAKTGYFLDLTSTNHR